MLLNLLVLKVKPDFSFGLFMRLVELHAVLNDFVNEVGVFSPLDHTLLLALGLTTTDT